LYENKAVFVMSREPATTATAVVIVGNARAARSADIRAALRPPSIPSCL